MEIYKDIKGFEGIYQVSNLGNVRRVYKKKQGFGILNPVNHSGGYSRLKLRNKGNDKDVYIHRLVAEAFITGHGNQVNHIDGNKKNNSSDNLEWCNSNENVSHYKNTLDKSSKFTGVYFVKSRNKFSSRIMISGKRKHLGNFNCETRAHLEYLRALKDNGITNKYS